MQQPRRTLRHSQAACLDQCVCCGKLVLVRTRCPQLCERHAPHAAAQANCGCMVVKEGRRKCGCMHTRRAHRTPRLPGCDACCSVPSGCCCLVERQELPATHLRRYQLLPPALLPPTCGATSCCHPTCGATSCRQPTCGTSSCRLQRCRQVVGMGGQQLAVAGLQACRRTVKKKNFVGGSCKRAQGRQAGSSTGGRCCLLRSGTRKHICRHTPHRLTSMKSKS